MGSLRLFSDQPWRSVARIFRCWTLFGRVSGTPHSPSRARTMILSAAAIEVVFPMEMSPELGNIHTLELWECFYEKRIKTPGIRVDSDGLRADAPDKLLSACDSNQFLKPMCCTQSSLSTIWLGARSYMKPSKNMISHHWRRPYYFFQMPPYHIDQTSFINDSATKD